MVIAVILILLSLLQPALKKAIEQAKKIDCMNRQKQFIHMVVMMAMDDHDRLPSGGGNHTRGMTTKGFKEVFVPYISDLSIMTCPNVYFIDRKGGEVNNEPVIRGSYVHMGMQYFGNHNIINKDNPNDPMRTYYFPRKLNDSPDMYLTADDNSDGPSGWQNGGGGWVMTPHGEYEVQQTVTARLTPFDAGADGGNVGYLDNSVRWKDVADLGMYYNRTSNTHRGYW